MYLEGQGANREKGYAMAALLVTLAVMAVLMSAAMPVWKHQAQREKEHELVFRLTQYAIAIQLWRAKFQSPPPNIDILVQQRFLRKKYKDPITGEDFEVIPAAAPQPGIAPQLGRGAQPGAQPGGQVGGGFAAGGIAGVRSKSKESSIRVWRGATIYQQFTSLLAMPPQVPGAGRGDGRGGPGTQQQPGMPGFPGGRGTGPGGGRNPTGGMGPGGIGPGRGLSPNPGGPGGGRAGTGPGGRGRGRGF